MKKVQIIPSDLSSDSSVKISGSKSESNRVLILNSIFKNIKESNDSLLINELNIFYSEAGPVTNKWIPHKLNPITVNAKIARNGGVIFQDNKVFRIAQKNSFNFWCYWTRWCIFIQVSFKEGVCSPWCKKKKLIL